MRIPRVLTTWKKNFLISLKLQETDNQETSVHTEEGIIPKFNPI